MKSRGESLTERSFKDDRRSPLQARFSIIPLQRRGIAFYRRFVKDAEPYDTGKVKPAHGISPTALPLLPAAKPHFSTASQRSKYDII